MSKITGLLNEALSTGGGPGGADGAGSIHPDAPGASYRPGLNKEQMANKLRADYEAYRDSKIVGGNKPNDYASWLKKKKYWDSQQKTVSESKTVSKKVKQYTTATTEKPALKPVKIKKVDENVDTDEINKLLLLSGLPRKLANASSISGIPVAESEYFTEGNGLGLAYQRQLDEMLDNIESSINGVSKRFSEFKTNMDKLGKQMTEEEQMHYRQGVNAMIDLMTDVAQNLRHRLG